MNVAMDAATLGADAALRRCALALHGLGERDRQWLLANLPGDRRLELESLVAELQTLGIPADSRVAQEAIALAGTASAHSEPAAQPPAANRPCAAERVNAATPFELARLLDSEPPALVAHVIALRRDCADAILRHLSTPKRHKVQQLLSFAARHNGGVAAARLSETLLEQLAARLQDAARAPARSLFAAAKQWWSRRAGITRMTS